VNRPFGPLRCSLLYVIPRKRYAQIIFACDPNKKIIFAYQEKGKKEEHIVFTEHCMYRDWTKSLYSLVKCAQANKMWSVHSLPLVTTYDELANKENILFAKEVKKRDCRRY
jgi:hypothetical protein